MRNVSRQAGVPGELSRAPFRGSVAVDAGLVTKNQLRGPAYTRLFRGIYVRRGLEADASVRLAALRLHLDGSEGVVRGLTAAWLHGVWRPAPGDDLPLEFARSPRKLGHDPASDLVRAGGLLVTSKTRTCFDLMRRHGLVEAVVVADAFAASGAISLPVLAGYCEDRRRWPEVRHARLALTLAHAGARSPGETRLRMVVVLAGYEEPLVNVPVHDRDGAHLGTPDLTVPGRSWVHLEYDGAYHDEAAQHGRDLRRQNALIGYGGAPLLRFDWRHVLRQRECVLRDLALASGERPRRALDDRDFVRGPRGSRW